MAINENFSNQNFGNMTLEDVDPAELNNSVIRNSNFSQECTEEDQPYTKVFPDGMTGVTFKGCNLVNVEVPAGNTVILLEDDPVNGCCHQLAITQNDGELWICEEE